MEPPAAAVPSGARARFGFAPPRHFLLPAVLLLLLEAPAHGYSLVKELHTLRLGRIDRPSVYRALAQLESDGLVRSSADGTKAGQSRRVYRLTPRGERSLRAWMGVIKDERDGLDRVLRRYAATGTIDAVLAGVEGAWAAIGGRGGSSVCATPEVAGRRRAVDAAPFRAVDAADGPGDGDGSVAGSGHPAFGRFDVVPERSTVLIEARSSVGPITFAMVGVTGVVETAVGGRAIDVAVPPRAHLEVDVGELASGNPLYDAELLRRIDARRFPVVQLDLRDCTFGAPDRLHLSGDVTIHGVTRSLEGTVTFSWLPGGRLTIDGEQVVDIRDFEIASPAVLMLRIYPDVVVHLHVEAELAG